MVFSNSDKVVKYIYVLSGCMVSILSVKYEGCSEVSHHENRMFSIDKVCRFLSRSWRAMMFKF